jgi:hypothetical protein
MNDNQTLNTAIRNPMDPKEIPAVTEYGDRSDRIEPTASTAGADARDTPMLRLMIDRRYGFASFMDFLTNV